MYCKNILDSDIAILSDMTYFHSCVPYHTKALACILNVSNLQLWFKLIMYWKKKV